jgi:hypothetical protein
LEAPVVHSTRAFHFSILLLLAACGDDGDKGPRPLGGACGADTDCTSGLVCEFRLCQQPCSADSQCPAAERCVRGLETDDAGTSRRTCLLSEHEACTSAVDCLGRQVCASGECRDQCIVDEDCSQGQECRNNDRCYSTDPAKDNDGGI